MRLAHLPDFAPFRDVMEPAAVGAYQHLQYLASGSPVRLHRIASALSD
jgi:hypothetical protein